jgi:hypothetical protein
MDATQPAALILPAVSSSTQTSCDNAFQAHENREAYVQLRAEGAFLISPSLRELPVCKRESMHYGG